MITIERPWVSLLLHVFAPADAFPFYSMEIKR
jgi:hypothetical protein